MNLKIASDFAKKNLGANKRLIIPFIISSSIMLIIFNIMSSLLDNKFVQTRHAMLPFLISLGVFIVFIFSFIFVVYANRFLMKRRNKELALYAILGLEKKHIRVIIFIEQLINFSIITVMTIIGGYILGKFTFISLNRLLGELSGGLKDYPFSISALKTSLVYILFLFIVVFFINVRSIKNSSPVELLSKQYKGEGEPKTKMFLFLMGAVILFAGYFLALTIEGNLKSLLLFFLAAVLVIIATYLLFISLSILVLKVLKSNKRFYYRDKNFLSISGMMYRMKSNAVGLASIAVLSTGVIITLSVTSSIYGSIDMVSDNLMDRDFSLGGPYFEPIKDRTEIEFVGKQLEKKIKSVDSNENVEDLYIEESINFTVVKNNDELLGLDAFKVSIDKNPIYTTVTTIDSFNKSRRKNIDLGENEVIVSSNNKKLSDMKEIKLGGRRYKVRRIDNIIASNIGVEAYKIVVADYNEMVRLANFYKSYSTTDKKMYPSMISLGINWNLKNPKEDYIKKLKSSVSDLKYNNKNIGTYIESKDELIKSNISMNGGFLFLGIVIGILFLTGTILITYYKQISEAYEDRENFQIMKKVGLPDKLIKKTTYSQIIWMFFAPLLVSLVHSIFASKITFQLLGLFGVNNYKQYSLTMMMVIGSFAIVYFVIFRITSNVYYKIVS